MNGYSRLGLTLVQQRKWAVRCRFTAGILDSQIKKLSIVGTLVASDRKSLNRISSSRWWERWTSTTIQQLRKNLTFPMFVALHFIITESCFCLATIMLGNSCSVKIPRFTSFDVHDWYYIRNLFSGMRYTVPIASMFLIGTGSANFADDIMAQRNSLITLYSRNRWRLGRSKHSALAFSKKEIANNAERTPPIRSGFNLRQLKDVQMGILDLQTTSPWMGKVYSAADTFRFTQMDLRVVSLFGIWDTF
jgi:hypothetical protein